MTNRKIVCKSGPWNLYRLTLDLVELRTFSLNDTSKRTCQPEATSASGSCDWTSRRLTHPALLPSPHLTIFIRTPHSRQTQTDKMQLTNTTNTKLRHKA